MSEPKHHLSHAREVLVNVGPRYGTVHSLECKFANRPGALAQYERRFESEVATDARRCRKCGG